MTSDRAPADSNEDLLATLLRLPHAVFAAVASDGVLVPMPASIAVDPGRVLPLPPDRSTMLDVVVPADGLTVVGAWERALATGLGFATVHNRQDPDQAVTLNFLDLRPTHGVLLGALDALDPGPEEAARRSGAEAEWISVSRTPRTAAVHKSGLAIITAIDERTTRMLGWTAEQMVGVRSSEFVHPDDQERAIANWLELLSTQSSQRVRLRHRRADGSWAWLELENQYVPADDPADAVVITHMNDISDEMAAHEALRQQERLLRRVAESLPLGVLQLTGDRSVVFANARFDKLVGQHGTDRLAALTAVVDAHDRPALEALLAAALDEDRDGEVEVAVRAPDGQIRVCSVGVIALGDREGAPGALLSLSDVSAHVRTREQLTVRATTDPLTGIANREGASAALDEALAGPGDHLTAVLFIDLDAFKPINDTHGHDVGDEVLKLTAERLRAAVRPDDVVSRIGGDEFLVVSPGHADAATALALGRRVEAALAEPVSLPQGLIPVRASIGVSYGPSGADSLELIRQADQAMYRAKQRNRATPVPAGR